jgi:hypothetical protein
VGVYELSGAGSVKTPRTAYSSMNAGNQFGAMVPIADAAISNGAKDFFNIPQTYQDLFITMQVRGLNAGPVEYLLGQVNLSSTGHSFTGLYGDGASATSSRNSPGGIAPAYFYLGLMPGGNATAGLYGTFHMHIINYRSSTNKTFLWRLAADLNGSGNTSMGAGLFASTSPVTSVSFLGSNGFNGGGSLYGIRAANS